MHPWDCVHNCSLSYSIASCNARTIKILLCAAGRLMHKSSWNANVINLDGPTPIFCTSVSFDYDYVLQKMMNKIKTMEAWIPIIISVRLAWRRTNGVLAIANCTVANFSYNPQRQNADEWCIITVKSECSVKILKCIHFQSAKNVITAFLVSPIGTYCAAIQETKRSQPEG